MELSWLTSTARTVFIITEYPFVEAVSRGCAGFARNEKMNERSLYYFFKNKVPPAKACLTPPH